MFINNSTTANRVDTGTIPVSSCANILLGARLSGGSATNIFTGKIDLNTVKYYADGSLVYQPCLKIPYTESKTGSKIVNAVYRDRVNDMYEQYGNNGMKLVEEN